MKKVYLVYDVFYDNDTHTTTKYLKSIYSSMSAARNACFDFANDLMLNEPTAIRGNINITGDITVHSNDGSKDHFIIEEWSVQ